MSDQFLSSFPRNSKRDTSYILSQDTADVFVRLSDYTIPMKDAHIVCHEADTGSTYVHLATTLKINLEKIIEAIVNGTTISYFDGYRRKVHCQIFFYGSEKSCREYIRNQELVDPPKNNKRQRISSGDMDRSLDSFSSSPVLIELDSCQSGEITGKEREDSMRQVFDKIHALHQDIRSIKEMIGSLSQQIQPSHHEPALLEPEAARQTELEAKFKSIIIKQRSQRKWITKINSTEIDFVDDETAILIRQLFICGTDEPGSFARNLAIYIFGEEKLVKTSMGRDGKLLKGKKEWDPSKIFTAEEEQHVLQLYMLIDEKLFACQDAFEYLIRNPIYQLVRDLKEKSMEEQDIVETGKKSRRKNQKNSVPMLSIMNYFKKQAPNNPYRPSTSKDN